MPLDRFWYLTPRALRWHHKAAAQRADQDLIRAYSAQALGHLSRRGKRFPRLDDFLGRKPRPTQPQDYAGTARDFMRHFAASYRGQVIHKPSTDGAAPPTVPEPNGHG